ncbi:MAG TPA: AraC family transcriptional regulator [Candidatus Dormibacteraeota bacterium]|nr:AraC family transcriptional regulator [Candidatus Dormibacteraeota bacterium]
MDPLSEALRSLPLSGCLIARAELNEPWGISLSGFDAAVFHVMISGSCWLDPAGGSRVHLTSGDIGVLMHGQPHTLRSDPDAPATDFADLLAHCAPDRFPTIHLDGGGRSATMLCGFFKFDRQSAHPLLRMLPDVVHVNAGGDAPLLEGLLALADKESAAPRPGSGALVDLMCGLLLVQMLRAQLSVDPDAAAPWILGLKDRRVATALDLIHERPGASWTVASLASRVAMSRSSFAARFAECVGEGPMSYLARCRILRAAHMLGTDRLSVAEAMHRVGYRSESSFSKAFVRCLGCTPGAYRDSARPSASSQTPAVSTINV